MKKREDGYHDLASLFHIIDLGDEMDFTLLPESATLDELTCNMDGVPTDESNLVIKVSQTPTPHSMLLSCSSWLNIFIRRAVEASCAELQ